jgi:hypothetical protein
MEYEYKVVVLAESDNDMLNYEELQEWFDKGWEYVNSISQPVAVTSNNYNLVYGNVIAIVRKTKNTITF